MTCTTPTTGREETAPPAPSRRRTPLDLPGAFWTIWTAILVNRLATFVTPFLLLYLTTEKGVGLARAGLMVSMLGLGSMVSTTVGGWAADVLGRRPTMLTGYLLSGLSLLGLARADGPHALGVAVLAVGLTGELARPAMQAYVADVVPEHRRVRAYSLTFWAVNIGFSVATLAAGLLSGLGLGTLFVVDGLTTLVAGLLLWLALPRPARSGSAGPAQPAGSVWPVLRHRRILVLTAAATAYALVYQQAYTTLPVVMGRDGLGPEVYGPVVALNGLVIVVLQPWASTRVERHDLTRVYAASLALVGLGFGATLLATSALGHALVVALWSVGEVGCAAVISSLFVEGVPERLRGRVLALLSLTFAAGMAGGPAVGTWVLDGWGAAVLWSGCAALLVLAALAVTRFVRTTPSPVRPPTPIGAPS